MVKIKLATWDDVWFSSDLHLGQTNILKYERGQFETIEEMHKSLEEEFAAKLRKNSIFFHLGDFSFMNRRRTKEWRDEHIPCLLYNIDGNHDGKDIRVISDYQHDVLLVEGPDGQKIWLSHYAHRVWPYSHYGSWHLYGHSHGNLEDDPHALSMDVGVDPNNMKLLCYDDIKAHMDKKEWRPVDHHGR